MASAQEWLNSMERRMRDLMKGSNQRFQSIDKKFAELDNYLKSPSGDKLPFDAQSLDDLTQKVQTLEYVLKTHEESSSAIRIRPERAVAALLHNPTSGETFINPVKEVTKPFWLKTSTQAVAVTGNGLSQTAFSAPIEENVRGDLEIFTLAVAAYTSISYRTRLTHGGRTRNLQNNPIHARGMWGDMTSGPQPFFLYESIFLEPGQQLFVEYTDFSGSTNTIETIAQARRFLGYDTRYLTREQLIRLFYSRFSFPFWMTSDSSVTLASNTTGTVTGNFTLDRGFDFEIGKAMHCVSNTSTFAEVASYAYRLSFTEGRSGRAITDGDIHAFSIAGSSNFPMLWMEPHLLKRGTPLVGTFINSVNGTANRGVDFILHGRGLPYMGLPDQLLGDTIGADALVPFNSRNDGTIIPRTIIKG